MVIKPVFRTARCRRCNPPCVLGLQINRLVKRRFVISHLVHALADAKPSERLNGRGYIVCHVVCLLEGAVQV